MFSKSYVYMISALGGLMFGFDQGMISNLLLSIKGVYHLNIVQLGHYTASIAWGACVGVLSSGYIIREYGRKCLIILSSLILSFGALFSAFTETFQWFLFGRECIGVAVGMMSFGVPIYLSEIAPTAIRGRITTLFQLLVTVGILVITITAFFLIEHLGYSIESIRYLFYLVFSGGVLMSVTSVVLPASPHWLICTGKTMIAHEVFKQMGFTSSEIDQEFKIAKLPSFNYFQQCADFFKNRSLLLLALLGSSLFLLQQLMGINIIIVYAPRILDHLNIPRLYSTLSIYGVNVIATVPALFLIERIGRKKLLIYGALVMLMSTATIGLLFLFTDQISHNLLQSLMLIDIMIYMIAFACSWGGGVWVVCTELFPFNARMVGITMTTLSHWLSAGIVLNFSLDIKEQLGNTGLFWSMSGFCLIGLVIVAVCLKETAKIALASIYNEVDAHTMR